MLIPAKTFTISRVRCNSFDDGLTQSLLALTKSSTDGGWLQENPIPEGSAQYGTFQAITERNQKIISSILESPIDKSVSRADRHNLESLQNFWSSCTSEDTLDKAGSKPLLKVLDTVIKTWRGETVEPQLSLQDHSVEYDLSKKKKEDKKKWDPKTKRQRLTNALAFLHSRGTSARASQSFFLFFLAPSYSCRRGQASTLSSRLIPRVMSGRIPR